MAPPDPETTESSLAVTLARIEIKLDHALGVIKDHEARLRLLERARWPLPALAILISIASVVASLLVATH